MSNDDDYAPDEEAGRALSKSSRTMPGRAPSASSMIRGSANIAASQPKLTGRQPEPIRGFPAPVPHGSSAALPT